MILMRLFPVLPLLIALISAPLRAATLLEEKFDTTAFAARGWFDGAADARISTTQHIENSVASLEMAYAAGATKPLGLNATLRHSFAASESVYVRYYVKYSDNWQGSNKSYHPHEFFLLTNADGAWIGPATTHFTAYIEQNEGRLQLGMQDSLNIDTTKIGVDLTNVTENRAVAGCNGNADGIASDCYLSGTTRRNGKMYKAASVNFTDAAGPDYKGNWHKIEVWFKMNSIVNAKGQPDGIMRMWFDGRLIIDRSNLIMRTAANASMKFNSILIGPYIGDGSPVAQTAWVDDMLVTDTLPVQARPSAPAELAVQ